MIDAPRPNPTAAPPTRALRSEAAPGRPSAEPQPGERFRQALKRLGAAETEAGILPAPADGLARPDQLPVGNPADAAPEPDQAAPPAQAIAIAPFSAEGAEALPLQQAGASAEAAFANADRFERALDAASRSTETQISMPAGWAAREVTLAVASDGNASMSLDMDMDERGRHADPAELAAPLARLGIRLIETEVLARRMREARDDHA